MATTTPSMADALPELSSPRDDELAAYHGLNWLAVIACILGFASPLALATPLLWTVPTAALIVGCIALFQIARQAHAGRTAAVLGMSLAACFLAWSAVRIAARQYHLQSVARGYVAEWLETVAQGKTFLAHQMHLPYGQRQLPGSDLAKYYENSKDSRDKHNEYFAASPLKELVAAGSNAEIASEGLEATGRDANGDYVAFRFRLKREPTDLSFRIVALRTLSADGGQGRWQIENVQLITP